MAKKIRLNENELADLIYEQVVKRLGSQVVKTYLIELSAADGGGMYSTKYYYLADCAKSPVTGRGELTDEALASLSKRYPQTRFSNSGYFDWRVVSEGEEAVSLYKKYQAVKQALKELRDAGIEIKY